MEVAFQEVSKRGSKSPARYIDHHSGRLYIIYGGCIYSISTRGPIKNITKFGFRIKHPTMCAIINTELNRLNGMPFDRQEEEYIFTSHLGEISESPHDELIDYFTVEIRRPILCKIFVGLQVSETLEIRVGEVSLRNKVLRLFRTPDLINTTTGFRYQVDSSALVLTQAHITTLPKFIEEDLEDLFLNSLTREPIHEQSQIFTPIIITGGKIISTVAVGNEKKALRGCKKKTILSDHVQVKHIYPDQMFDEDVENFWECWKVLKRLWKMLMIVDAATISRHGLLATIGLSWETDGAKLKSTLRDEADILVTLPYPGQRCLSKASFGRSSVIPYTLFNYLLMLGHYPCHFDEITVVCERYIEKSGLKKIQSPETLQLQELSEVVLNILKTLLATHYVLQDALVSCCLNPKVQPKPRCSYPPESIPLIPETAVLLDAAKTRLMKDVSTAACLRTKIPQEILVNTAKRTAAALVCIYLYEEAYAASEVSEITGNFELGRKIEDLWKMTKEEISPIIWEYRTDLVEILKSIISFRLA
ncbi:tegument protein UL21 [Gallid alphaherpesvirus 1]|uniref:Tegument protein UL21 n=1 Tax=Infectious laryngotracheitis virus TaxID=10386 RepID=S4UZJ5_ILTV|nr:tegument protein UL21 [Gallid alphaherpesvirus 1]